MEIQLTNPSLEVYVKAAGAELTRIYSHPHKCEYLWDGNPKHWNRQSPVLFPIVGQLKNDTYLFNGKPFHLPRHGFARDMEFQCIENEAESVVFQLTDSPETLENYPFSFNLQIAYRLHSSSLEVSFRVANPGREPLPFSIGGHPAFRCPIVPDEKFSDYLIEFEKAETAQLHRLQGGLFSGSTEMGLEQQQAFPLRRGLFEKDALVFKHLASDWVALRSKKSGRFVEMDFSEFPYLGIWSKPKAPFVCLEPWHGLADRIDATGYLLDKEGIQVVMPGKAFEAAYRLTFG